MKGRVGGCRWVGWWMGRGRGAELYICQGIVTGLFYRDNVIEPIVKSYACRHGNASSLKTTTQEPIVHVLSRITCSFAEPRLSHGQRDPQTCLMLNTCATSSGDMSGDGLTSHRTSTSSLMHSGRNGVGFPKQSLVASSGA